MKFVPIGNEEVQITLSDSELSTLLWVASREAEKDDVIKLLQQMPATECNNMGHDVQAEFCDIITTYLGEK